MRPDPRHLHTKAVRRAGVLARSGNYAGWQEVEAALIAEGHAEAKRALQSQYLRDLLTDHCIEARNFCATAPSLNRS